MEQYKKGRNEEFYHSGKYGIDLTMTEQKRGWYKIEVSYIKKEISFTIKVKTDARKIVTKMKCNVDKKLIHDLFTDLCEARYSKDKDKLSGADEFLTEVMITIFEGTASEAIQDAYRTVADNRSKFSYNNPYLGSLDIELKDDGEYEVWLGCAKMASGNDKECTFDEQYDDLLPVLFGFSYCLLGEIPYPYDKVLHNVRAKGGVNLYG